MATQQEKHFLLVDGNASEAAQTAQALEPLLEQHRAQLTIITDGAEALDYALHETGVVLVITEYRLEGMGGLPLIEALTAERPHLACLLLSKSTDATIAIKAVQAGAHDFLPKPCPAPELAEVINEALTEQEPAPDRSAYAQPEPSQSSIIGKSRAMAKVYRDLAKLAATPVTVLIRGETGTGKEVIARALHEHGHRAHKPFIAVNCAAIPDNLLESELFGHERGAFTGATTRKTGRFEQAHGATLFLDEIGDMQPLLQAKMLRVLQEKIIQRVGGAEEIPVDVRIIAATHRNLGQMVEEGAFRADLFFRLNGSTLRLPPLRERLGDVGVLTHHFLQLFSRELGLEDPRITPEALSFLARQVWPGNVRQLQNVLRQVLLKKRGLTINTDDLRPLVDGDAAHEEADLKKLAANLLSRAANGELPDGAYREMIAITEQILLTQAMQQTKGNQSQAAQLLGITRYTLREKLKTIAPHPRTPHSSNPER